MLGLDLGSDVKAHLEQGDPWRAFGGCLELNEREEESFLKKRSVAKTVPGDLTQLNNSTHFHDIKL